MNTTKASTILFAISACLASLLTPLAAASTQTWTPNAQEHEIADRLTHASGQHRPFMVLDPILSRVARERAIDMAQRRYFDHINPDGHGANYLVRRAGYALTSSYPSDGNNLESIAAGYANAGDCWSSWMNSPAHKRHLLAEIDFFAAQTSYGIGYYEDAGSPYRTYWVVITAPPPENPATLTIASPARGAAVPESALTVTGATGGTPRATSVQVAVENAGAWSAWQTATGVRNWSANFDLLRPGANTLHVRSLSAAGAVLAEAARSFDYVVLRPLTIRVEGQGNVGGFSGTTQRRVGRSYTVTATPADSWLFAGWSGSWSGTQARFGFTMKPGLDVTASFVPNPFIALRGFYAGLVGGEDSAQEARGLLRMHLNALGRFSGRLFFPEKSYPILGRFGLDGDAVVRILRPNSVPLKLRLTLDPAGLITGTVQDGTALIDVSAAPALQAGDAFAAFAGEYDFALSVDPAANASIPSGEGFGRAVVRANGGAAFAGTLPDGRHFARSLWLSADGSLIFFSPLYRGAGSLTGVLVFGGGTVSGNLRWLRRGVFETQLTVH